MRKRGSIYAHASQVAMHIKRLPGRVGLKTSDDGSGFEAPSSSPENLGLGIMVGRAENIGAQLGISSKIGLGTQISVVWRGETLTG